MIEAYMASPKRFDKVDFDKVGSGTGVLRYAFGLYMGERETANKYFEDYENYGEADKRYFLNNKEIMPGSVAHDVAEFLASNRWKIDEAEEEFEGSDKAMKALKLLTDDFTKIDFDTKYAVLYKMISYKDMSILTDWDGDISSDELNELNFAFYNQHMKVEDVDPDIMQRLEDMEVVTDAEDMFTLIDNIFDRALEKAQEEDLICSSVDEDELRNIFYQKFRNDNSTMNTFDSEFDEAIDYDFIKIMEEITGNLLTLEDDLTYGDAYFQLCHALNPGVENIEKNIEGKRLASKFLSKEIGVTGYIADTKFGRDHAKEIIIIDEDFANEMRMEEIELYSEDSYDMDYQ